MRKERALPPGALRLCWLLSLLLWVRPAGALQETARVQAEDFLLLSWPGDPSRVGRIAPDGPVPLGPGEVLLIPVGPGDRVRVVALEGPRPVLGWATGNGAEPDLITWDLLATGELRLPPWSTARHLAVRVPDRAKLSVQVKTQSETALAWHTWDFSVAAALRAGHGAEGLPEGSAATRVFHGLAAVQGSVPSAERAAAAHLLQAAWLEQALRLRPLVGPYFTRERRLEFPAPRLLLAGERFELAAPGIDVLRWHIQAWGTARVLVREGDAVTRQLSWSAPEDGEQIPSRPRSIRVVPPARGGRVSLEVVEGKISFVQRAYIQRAELAELWLSPIHDRRQALELAARSRVPWVRAAAELSGTRGAAANLVQLAGTLPGGDLQAFLLLEAARAEADDAAALTLTERAASAAHSPSIQVLALQRRRDRLPPTAPRSKPRPLPPLVAAPALSDAPKETDLWLSALRGGEGLIPGARPTWGAQLERWAALREADLEVWSTVASFFRSVPYRTVLPSSGAALAAEFVPLEPAVDCPPPGAAPEESVLPERFDRWLLPPPGSTFIQAQLPRQHFAPLLIRPLATEPTPESSVRLGGVTIAVHSAAGISSEVAVSAGIHELQVPADALPLALRLPDGVQAPCEHLHRVRSWAELAEQARADFELPGAGSMSVARITLAPLGPGHEHASQELAVRVGSRQLEVWGRGARSGTSEIRIDPRDTLLSLEGRGNAGRVRVELRRAHDAEPAPEPPPASDADPEPLPIGLEGTLVALRKLGRSLRAARGEAALGDLRARRARLLEALGFTDLARRDAEPAAPSPRRWWWRPGVDATVVPVNLAAKVGPLPLPASPAGLAARRLRLRLGGCASFGSETSLERELPADAEALLLAHCAEQNELLPLAAATYAMLGRSQPNGAALARAATLLADQAVVTGEPMFALQARLAASRAAALGTDTGDVLGRLAPALQWVAPSAYEHAAGFATVRLKTQPQRTLGARVRRALVDAPDDALLIEGERAVDFELQLDRTKTLRLELGCEDPADLACVPAVWRDGKRFECPRQPGARPPCALPFEPGAHHIELRLPSEHALGWVRATLGKEPLPLRLASRWIDVEPQQPAQLTVRGPTVVRVEARGTGLVKQSLAWTACRGAGSEGVLELPEGTDPDASRIGVEHTAIGTEQSLELPIETAGPCTLRLSPDRGHVLVRLAVVRAVAVPRARASYAEPQAPPPPPLPPDVPLAMYEPPPPGPARLPLLLLGRSQAVINSRSLDEELGNWRATSSSHVELSAIGARELVPAKLWTTGQAGVRWRAGPPSWLTRWDLDMPATVGEPGIEIDTAGYFQEVDGRVIGSLHAAGALSTVVWVTPDLRLLPRVAYTLHREPSRPVALGVTDADVYSAYRASHPHYLDLEVEAAWRPLVDVLGKVSLSGRALPGMDGIDRVGVASQAFFMPLPRRNVLLDFGLATSYRPSGPGRSQTFLRHAVGAGASYWTWLTNYERLRFYGRLDGTFDVPGPLQDQTVLMAEVGVELAIAGDRGLRDLSPAALPFLDFQERGRDDVPAPEPPAEEPP